MTDTLTLFQALPAREVKVSGTTLYAVAMRELGDALQWTRIAELNGITDPWISTVTVLKIPGPGTSNGGIPNG